MTQQTHSFLSVGKSLAGIRMFRLSSLALAAAVVLGSWTSGLAQNNPATGTPAPSPIKKGPNQPAEKKVGKYEIHQTVELGGRFAEKSGSRSMFATMINQSTGMRVLDHSLQMRSLDPSKTPFFDRLSSSSFGYGGDPNDVSTLNLTKGRAYDFAGMFRRDRNYFDYNLLANSLLGPTELVPQTSSPHLFNTVRRNTNTLLTLFPVSTVHFRLGYNHNTHEGPSYSTVHEGGDVQVLQWFRNSTDTYVGGVDVKVAPRSMVSYDQYFIFYRGDSPYALTGPYFTTQSGAPVSVGINLLTTSTCGSNSKKTVAVINGVVNPYCSQTLVQTEVAPTRTSFPTEQLRFSSHYWNRVAMNGRVTYSGDVSNVNQFNWTFDGLLSRTNLRREVDTGGLANGRLAHNKRVSVNADYGIEAELNDHFSISDAVNFWNFRIPGMNSLVAETWGNSTESVHSVDTPVTTLTPTTTATVNAGFLGQKNLGNTIIGMVTVTPQIKFSAGWRFNNREITKDDDPTLQWHQNWLLLGAVLQPQKDVRVTVNYDLMNSKSANSDTASNSYTRVAPNRIHHFRARATAKPTGWINFSISGNAYLAKNTDPLVNHIEHNYDLSFGTQIVAADNLSFDFAVSHDDVYSRTDLCYFYGQTSAPYGDPASTGTCLQTADNPGGTLPTASITSQFRLGNGYYSAPSTFFSGGVNYAPTRYIKLNGGVRVNDVAGQAEMLNPYMVPGALQSTILQPYADLQIAIAPQWTWHGNWNRQNYDEAGPAGPGPRDFRGDIYTLGVRYAF